MLKIAALVLDIYDDEDASLARRLPNDLHDCKVAARDEVEALPDRSFALVMKTASGIQRRFPLHTSDALKLSWAYFDQTKAQLPAEAVAAADAKFAMATKLLAGDLQNEEAVAAYSKVAYVDITALHPRTKAATGERFWGLVIDGKNTFPLHDESLVKQAMSRFPFTRDGLEPHERFLYARNLIKRAAALGVSVPENSQAHLYSNDYLNLAALGRALDARKTAAVAAGVGYEVLEQLAAAAGCALTRGEIETDAAFAHRQAKHAACVHLTADQIVPVLQSFDKQAGISNWHYLRGLPDPFASCYKQATCQGSPCLVDGIDLSKVPPEALAQHFDAELAKEFSENPVQTYQALPDPVKSLVRQLATTAMNAPAPTPERHYGGASIGPAGDPTAELNPSYANGRAMQG